MASILNIAIFLPLVGAFIVSLFRNEWLTKVVSIAISGVVFALSVILLVNFNPNTHHFLYRTTVPWILSLGINYDVGLDGLGVSLFTLTALIFFTVFIWAIKVKEKPTLFYALFLILETTCLGTFSALDLFLFYLFWEGMLVPMYFIIGFWGHDRKIYAANKFFIYTFFGSLFLLLGLATMIVYGYFISGHISFEYDFHRHIAYPIWLQIILFVLFGIGFAVKVPMWPVHTWLPDAHVEAPTAGSVVLAGVLLKMGTFGFVRYSLPLFPQASKIFIPVMFVLSIIAIIYAAMMAISQTNIKKLIAYSSISHMGMVTLGTFALSVSAINGASYMMIAHGLSSAALFYAAGFIYDRFHSYEMSDLGGIAKYLPNFAILFMISGLASIGLPGFSGFVSEFLILLGTFKYFPMWAIVAGVGMVLGAAYFLYMYKNVMLESASLPESKIQKLQHTMDLELHHIIPFVLVLFGAFIMGIMPYNFVNIVSQTSKLILGRF